MDLRTALLEPMFAGLSDADALAAGNQTTIIAIDSTPYTWSGIGAKLIAHGVTAANLVELATNISTLPGGPVLDKCLSSGGFDFSAAENRALIQSFEVSEPQWAVDVLNAMLAIGQTSGTYWQMWGLAQPTLADITAARAANLAQQQITTFFTNTLNPLVSAGTTPAAIKTAVDNWVASLPS